MVDDGSTDNSLLVCRKLEKVDGRIEVFHKKNGGVSSARNVGLEAVKGDYLLFVDADDYVKENYVEKLCEVLTEDDADVAECGIQIEDVITGSSTCQEPRFSVMNNCEMVKKSFCRNEGMTDFLWDKIYKAELFEGLRFKKWRCSEDFELLARLVLNVNKVVAIKEALYVYVREPGSVGKEKFSEKKLDVIKAREETIENYLSIGEFELAYMIAVQILSQIYILYEQILDVKTEEAEKYRRQLVEYFDKYYAMAKRDKHSVSKNILRLMKFILFRINPKVAVKVLAR